eukprot:gene18940-20845_t
MNVSMEGDRTWRNYTLPGKTEQQSAIGLAHWLACSLTFFAIGFIVAKWKDGKADRSVRGIMLPMRSLYQRITWYEVLFFTADAARSGTTANVYLRITCTEDTSAVFRLSDVCCPGRKPFLAGSVASFLIPLPAYIGVPIGVHIWHDNAGDDPCWLLETMSIRNTEGSEIIHFNVNVVMVYLSCGEKNHVIVGLT